MTAEPLAAALSAANWWLAVGCFELVGEGICYCVRFGVEWVELRWVDKRVEEWATGEV